MASTESIQPSLPLAVKYGRDDKENHETCTRWTTVVHSFQLFTLESNHIIRQARHPKAFLNHTLHGLKCILGAGVDEAKQAFDNGRRGPIAFEIDQRFAVASAGNLGGFLGVIREVMAVERCETVD